METRRSSHSGNGLETGMCNLYDIGPTSSARQKDSLEERISALIGREVKPHHIRKTDPGIVVQSKSGELSPTVMRWGFSREFNPAINNTRADKLDSGMWKTAWAEKRRCVIPVAAFYEWKGPKGQKQTYAFTSKNGEWLWMAGLWERNEKVECCGGFCFSMITTAANEAVSAIHHRMPVILERNRAEEYLEAADPAEMLKPRMLDLNIFPCQNPLTMKNPSPPVPSDVQSELF